MNCKVIHWLIHTDSSNTFNSVKRATVLTADRGGHLRADAYAICRQVFWRDTCLGVAPDNFGEKREMDCSSWVQHGDAIGPALFCRLLLQVPERVREEPEPGGAEFAYLDMMSASA